MPNKKRKCCRQCRKPMPTRKLCDDCKKFNRNVQAARSTPAADPDAGREAIHRLRGGGLNSLVNSKGFR